MTRRLAAVLTVLALAACFGRVSAWAAAPEDAHACCRGESPAPAKAPTLVECCPVPAAVHAVKTIPSSLVFFAAPAPSTVPSLAVPSVAADASAPPGPQMFRSSVPARAPPLA